MTFKEASTILTRCITLSDLAAELGVARNTVLRARMTGRNARAAPEGWERAVAKLARRRAIELERLAAQLGPR